jgi:hypothetical protein
MMYREGDEGDGEDETLNMDTHHVPLRQMIQIKGCGD